MNDLGLMIDESLDARIMKAVKDMKPEEFRDLSVRLLENMGLKVTAAALSDDVVFAEGSGKEGAYLVMVSRHKDHASVKGLKSIKDKASAEGRLPALVVTHEFENESLDFAKSSGIAFADRPKFLVLMKRFDLARPLLREVDKKILEREGDRFLPSVGKLDDLMESADDDIEHSRYKEALAKLDRALELKPTHYAALQKKTNVLMELGDYKEALATCRKAAELMPNDATSWYLMGLILHELGDLKKEIEAYDMALKFSPRMTSAMLNKGATLFQLGKLDEALAVYDTMLRAYPNSQRALNNRGLVLKAMRRSDEALQAFDSAAATDPSFVDPLVNKGSMLLEMGKLTEAIESLREAVRLQRGRSDLWMKLALAQKSAGMFEEAAKSFAVAAVLDPSQAEATRERDEALAAAGMIGKHEVTREEGDLCRRYMASSLLMKASGELEGALNELEKCIEMRPGALEVYLNQAGILLELGRLEEALVALKEGVREDPRNNELLLDLEALTYRMGRKEDSLKLLEGTQDSAEALARRCLLLLDLHHEEKAVVEARGVGADGGRLDRILAVALIKQGKHREAAEVLERCLVEFPEFPELLNSLGVCLRFLGELDEAENVLNEAVEIAPVYADAWNNLGCVLYVKGALEEAEKCLSEALLIDRRPAFLMNVGMCRLSANDLGGAQELFTSALRMDQSADALNALGVVSERKKEIIKALELYEAALEKAPGFQDALVNRDRLKNALKQGAV